MMNFYVEPSKKIPVVEVADICVLGGSATGVFAAVRAARLGARVVIVEKMNCFGGVATSGMVNIWHSLMDTEYKKQIIAGMTLETVERLKRRDAVKIFTECVDAFRMNTEELKIELDELILEAGVKPYLHTSYVAPIVENGELKAIVIENKSGRSAIEAKMFIDATGDGDLCKQLGLNTYTVENLQPPTTGAKIIGMDMELYGMGKVNGYDMNTLILEHREEFNLPEGYAWSCIIPGVPGVTYQAMTRIFSVDCSKAEELTHAEIEGRRQVRAVLDLIRKYIPEGDKLGLVDLSAYIGIRETRHIACSYRLTEHDVLNGGRFDDAIANASMRVDIHHNDKPGITFKFMDGTAEYKRFGQPVQCTRWREKTELNPTFYQLPYRSLLPGKYDNLLLCGRCVDAEPGAFASIRVMVNMNQTGEAAGTAAYLAVSSEKPVDEIDISKLKRLLAEGGSIVI